MSDLWVPQKPLIQQAADSGRLLDLGAPTSDEQRAALWFIGKQPMLQTKAAMEAGVDFDSLTLSVGALIAVLMATAHYHPEWAEGFIRQNLNATLEQLEPHMAAIIEALPVREVTEPPATEEEHPE